MVNGHIETISPHAAELPHTRERDRKDHRLCYCAGFWKGPIMAAASFLELFPRNAFDFAPIGMAIVSPEGKWLQVNRAICEIVGYQAVELQLLTFQDITHPDDLEADLGYLEQLLRGEIRSYQMEKRYFHKNGHVVWVLLSVTLARRMDGTPLHFISQIQDITQRKQAEKAL